MSRDEGAGRNVFKINKKDITMKPIDVFLVYLMLTLNIFYVSEFPFFDFEEVNAGFHSLN